MGPAHVENVVDARLPHGARLPRRRPHHLPGRHAGAGVLRRHALASATSRTTPRTLMAAERAHADRGPARARRRRSSTPARRSRSWPGAARSAPAPSSSRSPSGSARRSSRRCSARRASPTTARTRPAASACSAPRPSQEALESCDTLLIVGSRLPVHRVLPEARPGARASRSTSTRRASACATRSRSASSATPARRSRRCCRCSSASRTARSWRRRRTA